MGDDGVTKVKLHKQEGYTTMVQDPAGLVPANTPDNSIAATEKKEDPDELGSEDFKEAADKAQVDVCANCKTDSLGHRIFKFEFSTMRKPGFRFAAEGI